MARTHKKVRYLPKSKAYTPVTAARDVEQTLKVLEGRWKLLILFHLFGGKMLRFSELERAIPAISQKMLIQQLRQMENDGMVRRIVHHQVPPKVEYALTDWGQALCPALDALLKWAALREEMTKETGAEIETVRCDVRLPDAVEAMMDRIWQKRPLDILVNNAAGQILAPTHKMSSRAIDAVLGVVLRGSAYCTVAAGRRWIDAGERNKVVMSILTVSALLGAPFTVPSAMAKAGVLAMTKSLAVEWGPRGIRTCAIVPGLFPTEGAWSRLMPKERGGDEG